MSKQKQEELKENDLAGIIESKLVELKPYGPAIGLIAVAVLVVAGGLVYYFSQSQNAAGEQWSDLFKASYKVRQDQTPKEYLNQAENHAGSQAGFWATQLAADQHFSLGTRDAMSDQSKAMESFGNAEKSYKLVMDSVTIGENPTLWRRAVYGVARSQEAQGNFDAAKSSYETLVEKAGDTAVGKASKAAIERISTPSAAAFFTAYKNFKFEKPDPTATTMTDDDAPGSDSGLDARPDFSYPVVREVLELAPSEEDAPPSIEDEGAPMPEGGDPAKTDPAKTEPAKTEPAETAPKPPVPEPTKK